MSDTTVLYHDDADGFTAAWAAWKKLGGSADYVPFGHGEGLPDELGQTVYCLDFCPKHGALRKLLDAGKRVVVIDHHKSAWEDIQAVSGDGRFSSVFSFIHSAAMLAWLHFQPDTTAPWLVTLVQDRDLWLHKEPFTHEINAWLAIQPHTFTRWDELAAGLILPMSHFLGLTASAVEHGRTLLASRDRAVARMVLGARTVTIAGHAVMAANAPFHQSEVAGILAAGKPFGAAWYAANGTVRWSLRSTPDGLDVSEVARRYGGGGHARAAGFECPTV